MNYVKMMTVSAAVFLTACGGPTKVSRDGTTDNPVWPAVEKSTFNTRGTQYGSWPNLQNVKLISAGMNKDQIANLIGRPHFHEGLYAVREWNYVFNFRVNGMHRICQYKVLFDTKGDAQSFFWRPEDCLEKAPITMNASLLFGFDGARLSEQGKQALDKIMQEPRIQKASGLNIEGFTDRLGADQYNLNLSQRRADAVKTYLEARGIGKPITATGRGSAQQVELCDGVVGSQLKACLEPNRRVEISPY